MSWLVTGLWSSHPSTHTCKWFAIHHLCWCN